MSRYGDRPGPSRRRGRVCVLVNGLPGSGKSTLARALAVDLDLPVLSKDAVKDFLASAWPREPSPDELSAMGHDALWALVPACPNGAVVETWFGPTGCDRVRRELTEAGIDAGRVAEVWCDCPAPVARARFRRRHGDPSRHLRHDHSALTETWWAALDPRPLGIGHQLVVDTGTDQVPDHAAVARRLRELLSLP